MDETGSKVRRTIRVRSLEMVNGVSTGISSGRFFGTGTGGTGSPLEIIIQMQKQLADAMSKWADARDKPRPLNPTITEVDFPKGPPNPANSHAWVTEVGKL